MHQTSTFKELADNVEKCYGKTLSELVDTKVKGFYLFNLAQLILACGLEQETPYVSGAIQLTKVFVV
jgi:hypothetical protein